MQCASFLYIVYQSLLFVHHMWCWYLMYPMFVCVQRSIVLLYCTSMPRAQKGKRVSDDASSISSASPKPARDRKRSRVHTSEKTYNHAYARSRIARARAPAAAVVDNAAAQDSGSGRRSRPANRPRRNRTQSLTGMNDETGEFRYITLTASQLAKGEKVCTHCNDHMSTELLHQHMMDHWDVKNNQWRTLSSRDPRLPHLVPHHMRPDIILGM